MKWIIYLLLPLLSLGCSLVPMYSIPNDHAQWVHYDSGKLMPSYIRDKCNRMAELSILGREEIKDVVDSEYLKNWNDILSLQGRCYYKHGYIFKVKLFSAYCTALNNVCEAYKAYTKYRW